MKLKLEKKPKKTEKKTNKKNDFLQKRTINLMYRERAVENDPRVMGPLEVLVLILIGVDHVLTLLDNRILRQADMKSCVYDDNVLNVVMRDATLQETADIVSLLYQDPFVVSVSVSTASTREQESANQKVVANITVELSNPQTEAEEVVAAE